MLRLTRVSGTTYIGMDKEPPALGQYVFVHAWPWYCNLRTLCLLLTMSVSFLDLVFLTHHIYLDKEPSAFGATNMCLFMRNPGIDSARRYILVT